MQKNGINILLVEDNSDHAELIIHELKNDGGLINNIHLARDGQEALDFLFRRGKYKDPRSAPRPGLVLLDLKLPKVDGIEVLQRVKSDPLLKMIPVVVLTTSSRDEDIAGSYMSGGNSFLTKPVRFEDFMKVVSNIKLYWLLTNTTPTSTSASVSR